MFSVQFYQLSRVSKLQPPDFMSVSPHSDRFFPFPFHSFSWAFRSIIERWVWFLSIIFALRRRASVLISESRASVAQIGWWRWPASFWCVYSRCSTSERRRWRLCLLPSCSFGCSASLQSDCTISSTTILPYSGRCRPIAYIGSSRSQGKMVGWLWEASSFASQALRRCSQTSAISLSGPSRSCSLHASKFLAGFYLKLLNYQ